MSLIKWNESISIDIKSIDTQHQRWIDMINDMYEAMRVGKGKEVVGQTLASMIDYARTHFSAEEALLLKHGYSEYTVHKSMHEKFLQKMKDLQVRQSTGGVTVTLEVMTSLKDWLVNHIQTVDRRYAPFLKQKGVA